ncbi:MAG: 2Fe-2S iron-sulfur cluster-binding protein [Planctomycetota bacterium]|jgi:NADH dehydrogenase/NADH:ubiquinone oxidoreductase subunit G
MPEVRLTIDGQPVTCERDALLLEVALANGFEIPALCYHEAEAPYGACRLCLVEITQGRWNWVEASCTYPVREDGIEVKTDSEMVRHYRRLNLELLLASCPDAEAIREMARKVGLEETRLPADGEGKCILCGLCVQVCRDLVGAGAISFVGRGPERRVDTPYGEHSEDCIGCGACAELCPTGHITVVDDQREMTREIRPFHTTCTLLPCPECGRGYVTAKQHAQLQEQLGDKAAVLSACSACRAKLHAAELLRAYQKTARTTQED